MTMSLGAFDRAARPSGVARTGGGDGHDVIEILNFIAIQCKLNQCLIIASTGYGTVKYYYYSKSVEVRV